MTDSLTELYNRRHLMVHLEKLLAKNRESRKSLCVLTLDIDHFKKINDTYGHAAGDEVLKTFAVRIKDGLRVFDLVARLGGEEFVVVLPDVSIDVAMQVADRLRRAVANKLFDVSVSPGAIPVTVSIGAAMAMHGEEQTVDSMLKASDEELYHAKENGRNCTYFAGIGRIEQKDDAAPLALESGAG